MQRLIIILVLGLLTIPHIQSQSSTDDTTDTTGATTVATAASTTVIPQSTTAGLITGTVGPTIGPTAGPTAGPTDGPTADPATESTVVNPTVVTSPVTTPIPVETTTTTSKPFRPIFACNFNTLCFANGGLTLTNGDSFNDPNVLQNSPPPPAPTSDVSSINRPTNNSEICALPFKPQVSGSTDTVAWDSSFCYNGVCPTTSGAIGACDLGSYGLASLDPSEPSKTITGTFNNSPFVAGSGEQCLRLYYFLTVYDQLNWGQNIQFWVRPGDQIADQFSIGNITYDEIQSNNNWKQHNFTFETTTSDYTLAIVIGVTAENRTETIETNKTIYFALDEIELYNYNCAYVNEQLNPQVTTALTLNTTTTEPTNRSTKPNLPLILGLSLGLGIPLLLAIIGLVYYFAIYKPKQKIVPKTDGTSNTTTSALVDIPLTPRNPKTDKNTVSV